MCPQKLISGIVGSHLNNSNKIIAVNTKKHSCEGVIICGKTHVDFHKTLTSIFSAYTTSIY